MTLTVTVPGVTPPAAEMEANSQVPLGGVLTLALIEYAIEDGVDTTATCCAGGAVAPTT